MQHQTVGGGQQHFEKHEQVEQVGGQKGRKLATVAGAVGGAVAGNQIEGRVKASRSYDIIVRLNDGSTRTFHQIEQPAWREGDRVRVVNGGLRAG